jgi:hypothetical protein
MTASFDILSNALFNNSPKISRYTAWDTENAFVK